MESGGKCDSEMAIRFTGRRYDGASIPLNSLDNLKFINEVVMKVARKVYLNEHPDRERVPKGFADMTLHICDIRRGSTIMGLNISNSTSQKTLFQSDENKAVSDSFDIVSKAFGGCHFDSQYEGIIRPYYNKIGKDLREDESIVFESNGQSYTYDNSVRSRLVKVLNQYESDVEIYGKVVDLYGEKREFTFEYCDSQGSCAKVIIPYKCAAHESELVELFKERAESSALLCGTGIFIDGSLKGFKNIETFEMLEPRDVRARIEEIVRLKPGWSGGDDDKEYDCNLLRRFASMYESHVNGNYGLPYIFPTPEAGLSIEWDDTETVLEVDSSLIRGVLLGLDHGQELDLGTDEGWIILDKFLSGVNHDENKSS